MAIDNKKEQEREELHRAIWAIADDLRGAVDGWDFKNYVLGTMFYRYISENLTAYINSGEEAAGNKGFDYAKMPDKDAEEAREGLVEEKGFFILPSELFCNVRAKADRGLTWTYPNGSEMLLNEKLEQVFNHIEDSAKGSISEGSFAGLFDDFDVNSNKLGSTVAKRNERLVKLLNGIASMDLGSVKDHEIDAFGDAYEYLMTMYASNAGKSGGEFFTPADVSVLLTRLGTVGKTKINKVYDPACGSGSLLLKVEKILGKDSVQIGFFGQEINITTYNLCRINMFLHDIGFDKFDIECEDTLINPQHWDDEPFELIVSNPPYSIKWAGDENPLLINDPRYSPAGVLAPKSKADLAFIMHSLSWLAPNGIAAIVCFPGIMYRGGAEQKIRKYLIDNNFVDAIIQLPSNLFFGTPIATCIMVMNKGKADNKVLFIDASEEYVKVTNNNKLSPENIDRIVDVYSKKEEIEYFSKWCTYDEIVENKYNLAVGTYVASKDKREVIDIVELEQEIEDCISEQERIRAELSELISRSGGRRQVRLDQLIGVLCPNGVEHKKVSSVFSRLKGTPITAGKMKEISDPEGDIRIFAGGKTVINAWEKDIPKANITRVPAVLVQSRGIIDFVFYDKPFTFKNEMWAYTHENITSVKYLYYVLKNNAYLFREAAAGMGSLPQISLPVTEDFVIPFPDLTIQEEIVDILEEYSKLNEELTSSLEKELAARQKQYQYYQNSVLNIET